MILRKGNVERIVQDEVKAQKLKAEGFKELTAMTESVSEKPAEVPQESDKNLEDMTVPELKALAKDKGVEGASSLGKEDLLAVLKEVM